MTKMSTPEHKTPRAVIHEIKMIVEPSLSIIAIYFISSQVKKRIFQAFPHYPLYYQKSTPNCTAQEPLPRSDQTYKFTCIRKFFAIITIYTLCLLDSQEREDFKIENRYFIVFTKNIMWTLRWPKTALIFFYIFVATYCLSIRIIYSVLKI